MRKLYYSPGTIALAPHILLCELGEPFEVIRVTVAENVHKNYKTPEFLKVTARGLVPFRSTDSCLWRGAVAIALHLAETAPEKQWLPPIGSDERARTYEWLAWLATTVLRSIGSVYRPEHIIDSEELYPPIRAFAERRVETVFGEIERAISPGSAYFKGNDLGVIDPFLLVFYRWGLEIGIDMSDFRRWKQLTSTMLERPAVVEALDAEEIEIKGFPSPETHFKNDEKQTRSME